ncbi:endo-1,4-beta-xylanase [Paenibacillus sp. J31TS4]|uniref:alpha/beta hydrolase n=1 Tax=Paenibacillus sp. J31TS4 TaxID=2807195 RepID=UPI001B22E12B|nr:alpha/beta hydrolase family protein [Paenibacillus sp. J31TS4]GIP38027.1 endo-1,4-beta-xylanase [Paenibacillus sp. J31TS4]
MIHIHKHHHFNVKELVFRMQHSPVTFFSGALHRRLTYYLFLPPSYEAEPERRYPVVYLLHGRYDSEISWPVRGSAYETADRLMRSGAIPEAILVMPSDGGYDRGTYYMDWYDGSGRFEQYFVHDLIPHIDRMYRTLPGRETRAIGGLSMGGYGSLLLALRNPDLFVAASSMSGALGMMPDSAHLHLAPDWQEAELARIAGPLDGPYAQEHNLAFLARRVLAGEHRPSLAFDCGTEDFLLPANRWLKGELESMGYPFVYREYPGAHTWAYWTEHLEDTLVFLSGHLGSADDEAGA